MAITDLDFEVTDESLAMQETALKVASEIWRPIGKELDRLLDPTAATDKSSRYWDALRQAYELGFHKTDLPVKLGGFQGEIEPCLGSVLTETLAYGDAGLAASLEVSSLPFSIAARYASETHSESIRAFCDDVTGELLGAMIVIDPASATGLSLTGEGMHIDGYHASWVVNAPIATHVLIVVPCEEASDGLAAAALAPLNIPGIETHHPRATMGLRSLPQGDIRFEDVTIGREQILTTDPSRVAAIHHYTIACAYCVAGQVGVGLAQSAYDEASIYAKERVQGLMPIVEHNNIKLKLFTMFSTIESVRAHARRVWRHLSSPEPSLAAAHALALHARAGVTALAVADDAVQVLGGNGLAKEYPTEKLLRDARSLLSLHGPVESLACTIGETLR